MGVSKEGGLHRLHILTSSQNQTTSQPANQPTSALCLIYPPLHLQEFRAGNKSPTGSYHIRIKGK